MFLKISLVLFSVFFGNVLWASLDRQVLLSDVQECMLLALSVLFFVVGILHREAGEANS